MVIAACSETSECIIQCEHCTYFIHMAIAKLPEDVFCAIDMQVFTGSVPAAVTYVNKSW